MSLGEIAKREKELVSQYKQIGMPSKADMKNSSNVVFVESYTRGDGTVVKAHWRSKGESAEGKQQSNESKILNKIYDTSDENEFIGNEASVSNDSKKPLYPVNGTVKGGIYSDLKKNISKLSFSDKIKEWLFTNSLTEKLLPMAAHSVKDGMYDLKVSKQNTRATIYNSIKDLKNKTLIAKFKSLGIPENIKGIVYDSKSKEAQKISKSKELNNYISEIINNDGISMKNTFEFKKNINIFSTENDLHYSLQNVTVYNPKISSDNKTFTCKIIDVSDFKERPKTMQNIPNNWGYKMQEKGLYRNYFQIYEIEVPLTEKQRNLLQKRKKN